MIENELPLPCCAEPRPMEVHRSEKSFSCDREKGLI